MTGPGPDIETALSGDGPIPSEQVLSWIDAAADSDLQTLSKLYRLTGEGYYRIQPELGRGPTCALIRRYLLGCIRDGVNDNDEIQERYEAAETLHVWFRQLVGMDGTAEALTAAANGLMKLYLEGGEEVRVAIETGFLEHALETAALRPYFEQWGSDPRLEPAWKRALEWGDAHPDCMAGLFQRLQEKTKE
jgi:hypothetical protein